jgi:hypothetical protein
MAFQGGISGPRSKRHASKTGWPKDLNATKIGILHSIHIGGPGRRGVVVPPRTLSRLAVDRCGAGRRTVTVRVDDPPPGRECQVDFGCLGLVPAPPGLIFTRLCPPSSARVTDLSPDPEEVIGGFEAAWGYFGGLCSPSSSPTTRSQS